jgi:hypothetical protein
MSEKNEELRQEHHHRAIYTTKTTLTNGPSISPPSQPRYPARHPQAKQCFAQQVVKSTGQVKAIYLVAAIDTPAEVKTIEPVPITYA